MIRKRALLQKAHSSPIVEASLGNHASVTCLFKVDYFFIFYVFVIIIIVVTEPQLLKDINMYMSIYILP